jgi:hypothetical protein
MKIGAQSRRRSFFAVPDLLIMGRAATSTIFLFYSGQFNDELCPRHASIELLLLLCPPAWL